MEPNGDVAKGVWSQDGVTSAMDFKRVTDVVGDAPNPPRRPQTPVPPFRYEIENVTFKNAKDKVTLAGTLTKPSLPEMKEDEPVLSPKYPAVVLISGSGPQDRDETLVDHKPFLVIADYLTKRGFAVLRYDDRGVAGSTGDFTTATSADFANDVRAAVRFLRQRDDIDLSKIGLIGHSEGGLIAPMVAAEDSRIAFIALLAGPGVSGFEILKDQGRRIPMAEGDSPEAVEANSQLAEAVTSAVRDASDGSDLGSVIDRAVDSWVSSLPFEQQATARPSDEAVEMLKQQIGTPWFQFFLKHDPATVLKRVECPVLAVNGETDLQVWHEQNLPAIVAALKSGGNNQFRAVRLPGLNHLFQRSETGKVSEYGEIELTIANECLDLVGDWIHKLTK